MGIITRQGKGSRLTAVEMDNNLLHLDFQKKYKTKNIIDKHKVVVLSEDGFIYKFKNILNNKYEKSIFIDAHLVDNDHYYVIYYDNNLNYLCFDIYYFNSSNDILEYEDKNLIMNLNNFDIYKISRVFKIDNELLFTVYNNSNNTYYDIHIKEKKVYIKSGSDVNGYLFSVVKKDNFIYFLRKLNSISVYDNMSYVLIIKNLLNDETYNKTINSYDLYDNNTNLYPFYLNMIGVSSLNKVYLVMHSETTYGTNHDNNSKIYEIVLENDEINIINVYNLTEPVPNIFTHYKENKYISIYNSEEFYENNINVKIKLKIITFDSSNNIIENDNYINLDNIENNVFLIPHKYANRDNVIVNFNNNEFLALGIFYDLNENKLHDGFIYIKFNNNNNIEKYYIKINQYNKQYFYSYNFSKIDILADKYIYINSNQLDYESYFIIESGEYDDNNEIDFKFNYKIHDISNILGVTTDKTKNNENYVKIAGILSGFKNLIPNRIYYLYHDGSIVDFPVIIKLLNRFILNKSNNIKIYEKNYYNDYNFSYDFSYYMRNLNENSNLLLYEYGICVKIGRAISKEEILLDIKEVEMAVPFTDYYLFDLYEIQNYNIDYENLIKVNSININSISDGSYYMLDVNWSVENLSNNFGNIYIVLYLYSNDNIVFSQYYHIYGNNQYSLIYYLSSFYVNNQVLELRFNIIHNNNLVYIKKVPIEQ